MSPVFGSSHTHLSGTSPFMQNPTCMKKGFTGMPFFSLILKKEKNNKENEILKKICVKQKNSTHPAVLFPVVQLKQTHQQASRVIFGLSMVSI